MQDYTFSNDALLAGAFARSQKMMRFIDNKYNADKDKYYKAAKKNDRFSSRFITGNRLPIRMNAIKALGVIELSKTDEELSKEMFEAAGRAFRIAYNTFDNFVKGEWKTAPFDEVIDALGVIEKSSDDLLHDTLAIYHYFCANFHLGPDKDSPMYENVFMVVRGKEQAYLKSFGDVGRDFTKEFLNEKDIKNVMDVTIDICGGKTLAEVGASLLPSEPETGFFQVLWDITQLDNIPASIYEGEKFSTKELLEIFNTISMNTYKGLTDAKDFNKYYITALFMRSFARLYHEAEAVVDEYAGIVRESDNQKELVRDNAAMASKIAELEKLAGERQEKLNAIQLELDREKKKNRELTEEANIKNDQIKILQNILQENETPSVAADEEQSTRQEKLELAKNKKVVVFGGPPAWQNELRKQAPGYTIVESDNYNFDVKIIDKADVIVIKTDYMGHAQWYKVVERARKHKKKMVIFSGNSIDELLYKICG